VRLLIYSSSKDKAPPQRYQLSNRFDSQIAFCKLSYGVVGFGSIVRELNGDLLMYLVDLMQR